MYGLSHDINLAFFEGKTLLQVCVGAHDLILNFDGIRVTVTSSIGLLGSGGVVHRYAVFTQAASALMTLLNQKVVSVEGDDAGTLTLTFDTGKKVFIYDDSKEYESYIIQAGEQSIIV
jgi:hypothetical protein